MNHLFEQEGYNFRDQVPSPTLGPAQRDLNCPLGCHYQSQLITALLQTNLHLVSPRADRGRTVDWTTEGGGEAPNISRTDQDTKQTPDSAR